MNVRSLLLLTCASVICSLSAADLTASLPTRLSTVTAGERQIELQGQPAVTGQKAPEFKVADQSFKAVKLSDFAGKTLLLSIVPSLDTHQFSLQNKKF